MQKQTSEIFTQGSNFPSLKKHCLREGVLYEDPLFPAVDSSLFFSKKPPRPFVWKRPSEIVADPQFVVGGASRFDIFQGMLGNSWFVATLAGLSMNEKMRDRVITGNQSFDQRDGYCGLLKFEFWHFGSWKQVVIDDRLPTYNHKLVFVHSAESNEFWSALLEKAYAKLHGSYEALSEGSVMEAMEDLTGGLPERIDMTKDPPNDLYQVLISSFKRGALLGCSINVKPGIAAKLPSGLTVGHPYTITNLTKVTVREQNGTSMVELIRIRSPWGNEREWNGAWSDGSPEWSQISESEKLDLGLANNDDGEFWMAFSDFKSHFESIDMCHVGPGDIWIGVWRRGFSVGGSRKFQDTFHYNPQFLLVLEKNDDEDDVGEDDGVSFRVGLMQRKAGVLTIGFAIYKTDETYDGNALLPKEFFLKNSPIARSSNFSNAREVSGLYKLPPGMYCIVPSTFDPNQEGEFLLRTFMIKNSKAIDETSSMVEMPQTQLSTEEDAAFDRQMRTFFEKVAGDDMEIDAWELQMILNTTMKKEMEGRQFNIESCKIMVASIDSDRSGKLRFEEFKELWIRISQWKAIFNKQDKDNSGSFDSFEMRNALRSLGFSLSNKASSALILRYANKAGQVDFDSFIAAVVKLRFLFTAFSSKESNTLEEFLTLHLYS